MDGSRLVTAVNGCFQLGWIEIEGARVDIDKDRGGAEQGDDLGGGDKGEGCGEHRIPGSDAVGHQAA